MFLPAIIGTEVTPTEHLLFHYLYNDSGLGVYRLHTTVGCCLAALKDVTRVIIKALHGLQLFEVDCHELQLCCKHIRIL